MTLCLGGACLTGVFPAKKTEIQRKRDLPCKSAQQMFTPRSAAQILVLRPTLLNCHVYPTETIDPPIAGFARTLARGRAHHGRAVHAWHGTP